MIEATEAVRDIHLVGMAVQQGTVTREHALSAVDQWCSGSVSLWKALDVLSKDGSNASSVYETVAPTSVVDAVRSVSQIVIDAASRNSQTTDHVPTSNRRRFDSASAGLASPSFTLSERFEIEGILGEGGMGTVTKSMDRELNRPVALKMLQKRHLKRPRIVGAFNREVNATAELEHPGIPPVFARGNTKDGTPWYAMRLVEGMDLRSAVSKFHKRGFTLDKVDDGLSLRELLRKFCSVCDTLEYAHQKDRLHCDISPGNIRFGNRGEVFLIDWGLTQELANEEEMGLRGVTVSGPEPDEDPSEKLDVRKVRRGAYGTPGYQAPEQAQGIRPTKETDIFLLGSNLYFLLTGEAPYNGTDEEKRRKAEELDLVSPRDHQPQLPKELEAICLTAMRKNPHQTMSSAAELSAEIKRFLDGEKVECYDEPLSTKLVRECRRRPGRVSALITGSAALTLLLAVGWYFSASLATQRQTTVDIMTDRLKDWFSIVEDARFERNPNALVEHAISATRKYRNLIKSVGDVESLIEDDEIEIRVGWMYEAQGNYVAALGAFQKAKANATDLSPSLYGQLLTSIGRANLELRNLAAAQKAFQDAESFYSESGNRQYALRNRINQAIVVRERGNLTDARNVLLDVQRQLVNVKDELVRKDLSAKCLIHLAMVDSESSIGLQSNPANALRVAKLQERIRESLDEAIEHYTELKQAKESDTEFEWDSKNMRHTWEMGTAQLMQASQSYLDGEILLATEFNLLAREQLSQSYAKNPQEVDNARAWMHWNYVESITWDNAYVTLNNVHQQLSAIGKQSDQNLVELQNLMVESITWDTAYVYVALHQQLSAISKENDRILVELQNLMYRVDAVDDFHARAAAHISTGLADRLTSQKDKFNRAIVHLNSGDLDTSAKLFGELPNDSTPLGKEVTRLKERVRVWMEE